MSTLIEWRRPLDDPYSHGWDGVRELGMSVARCGYTSRPDDITAHCGHARCPNCVADLELHGLGPDGRSLDGAERRIGHGGALAWLGVLVLFALAMLGAYEAVVSLFSP